MRILRADHMGMCFGVRDAIELAERVARTKPLTVLGELVHNETVLERLRANGVALTGNLEEAKTQTVMITAHGASEAFISAAKQSGRTVLEGTCPLVHAAHRALKCLVTQGFHPVIVGKRDHVEVRGMTGDLKEYDVILTDAEAMDLSAHPRIGIVAQTTQPIERVRRLVGLLRWRFPDSEIRLVDTVCQPTKQRQAAAVQLAGRVDVMIVVGGANSNNTRELGRTCSNYCPRVHVVESPGEVEPQWLDGAESVGLTAGTSTPDDVIDAVEQRLMAIAGEREAAADVFVEGALESR